MPSPRPSEPSVTLIHTTSGDLVKVQDFQAPPVSGAGVPLGLRRGEVVQCLRSDGDGVLIARDDGSRMLVPVRSARNVDVRWFPESLATEETPQGFPGGNEVGARGAVRRWWKHPQATQARGLTGKMKDGKRLAALRPE